MNKNFKIVTITGFRGVLMACFIFSGLIAGFIISPAWVCMKIWNVFVVNNFAVMPMNLFQGLLTWAVIALILYALNNKRSLIGFGSYPVLTKEQVNDIMNRAKMSEPQFFTDFETLQAKLKADALKDNKKQNNTQEKEANEQKGQ